jgi:hypothetical protein
MSERVIVSMTSYPGRITNVGKAIYLLLTKQTRKPDEIHLWLAIPQFPHRELDLPSDLVAILNLDNVFVHWLKENTYVHKRHEIFKQTTDDDCVFLIDDDVRYSDDLIQKVMEAHKKFPNSIICYNRYPKHKYNGIKIVYGRDVTESRPHINRNRWCGQSMIPSKLYPKEILDKAHQIIRNNTSPVSDECWFQPWTIWYNIPIYHLRYDWGTEINPKIKKNDGLCRLTHIKDKDGYTKRDLWLNAVLCAYPKIYEKYKLLFRYGKR